MSDAQSLLLVVVVFHLVHCLEWVRADAVLFVRLGRRIVRQRPGDLVGNREAGFAWRSPLPPLAGAITTVPWRFSVSPEGVYGFVAPCSERRERASQTRLYAAFETMESVEWTTEHDVVIDGSVLARLPSEAEARRALDFIADLAEMPYERREGRVLSEIARAFDDERFAERLGAVDRAGRPVRAAAHLMFALLFVVCPLVSWRLGFGRSWLPMFVSVVGAWIAIGLLFVRAHRALDPDAKRERRTALWTVMITPIAAMRADERLRQGRFVAFAPVTAAVRLLHGTERHRYVAATLRDLRYPLAESESRGAQARATEEWFRLRWTRAAEALARDAGVEPNEVFGAPRPDEPGCKTYCPRCRDQFASDVAACDRCGVEVRAVAS